MRADGSVVLGTEVDPLFVFLAAVYDQKKVEEEEGMKEEEEGLRREEIEMFRTVEEMMDEAKAEAVVGCGGFREALRSVCDVKS